MAGNSIAADRSLALEAGRRLANAEPGDEVVISGLSGFYPDSDNVTDFAEKLFNKVDLISDDDRRWKLEHPEIPQRTGKLNEVGKFDAAFFGVHFKQAHTMDPMCRMLLEKAYEAVVDSGYNPRQLRGSKTGVFIGACFSESEKTWFYEKLQVNGFGITGCSRAMLANRISYWLGINGPSYTVDSACSSSLYALEHAYKSIRDGHCDAAIVGGCNLCLHPYVSLQFARLGVLSPDGRCKSFDESANGYCRSEAVCIAFLQKAKDARRVYATVVHAKTNCDGYKEQGITFPSGPLQQRLLEEFYEECQIKPSSLAWVEAHGTGTRVGDPEEVKALENVFCPGRDSPLPIGSVKSNIGHSEPASGLCSVTKVIIAMETGFIPPNINLKTPRKDIDSFYNGKISVVTEKTPWDGGMVGVNSFGFGGANCHVLLKWNEKQKKNGGLPDDDIPRVVPASGRTEEAVDAILSDVESRTLDAEYVKLLHEVHAQEMPGHIYRGFTVLSKDSTAKLRSIKYYPGDKRPLWFVFSGMGSQWAGMGSTLMKIPVFAAAVRKCHEVLRPKGVDLLRIITDPDPKIFNNILNSFIGIAAVQIGLVDVLNVLGIVPDHLIGHSVGELGCAYADGCFTAEQMILAAYFRGLASLESKLITGAMAAVGMGYNDIKEIVPPEIDVACHNSAGSCTISGPAAVIKAFVAKLQEQKIFAREVNVANIAYHSRYIAPAAPKLLAYLKQVIPDPKPRSAKWVSSSVPENQWDSPLAKTCSAEYHTNNLLSNVLFEEASRHIQPRAITLEIAPHGLLQAILRRALDKQTINIALTHKDSPDNSLVLASALGKLYEAGVNPQFAALYPEVALPVSRGTPMIAPLVRWEHSEDWYVTSYRMQEKIKSGERTVNINLKDDELEYLGGHVIDGRNLYPATGYLALAWETVGLMRGELYTDVSVVFEDVRFHRATNLPKDGSVDFIVMVQKGSGNFEIVEGGAAIVTGKIYVPDNINKEMVNLDPPDDEIDPSQLPMTSKDFYKELRLRGYNYKGLFRSITQANNEGTIGQVQWQNNWVAFMDNMLQMQIIRQDTRGLFVPTSITRLVIDVKSHVQTLFSLPDENKELPVYVYHYLDLIKSGGVQIEGLKASAIARRKPLGEPVLEKYEFFNHISNQQDIELSTFVRMCFHLALENIQITKVKSVEILDNSCDPDSIVLSPIIQQVLGDLPLIQADINILSPADNPKTQELGPNILVEDKKITTDQSAILIIASDLFSPDRAEVLKNCLAAVKEEGFVLTREKANSEGVPSGYDVCLERTIESEKLILFRKSRPLKQAPITIKISANNYSWLPEVQAALKSENAHKKVILYAEGEPINGIIGFVNCVRKEPGGDRASCVFVVDKNAPKFSLNDEFYKGQLDKDLAVNVFKDGVWGSYRHFPVEVFDKRPVDHAYISTTVRGDLSSLSWLQGPLAFSDTTTGDKEIVHIYYSALNFRDVMMMTGKLAPEVVVKDRRDQECVCGFEFSGKTSSGRRVMAMTDSRCLSNTVIADKYLMWDIPDEWTLEQAATVPVVYGTALYAMITCGNMKKGDSILIHAGTGGVGQAAIYLALFYGLTVFTTVGTPEKREFIIKTFPQIKESHIGNSRDCSFEQMVMTETDGRGVDLVLNSLAEEKLLASVRCLAAGGRFLEIGKFDLANNNPLGMEFFLRETSFHGIQLDTLFTTKQTTRKIELTTLVMDAIKSGAVVPLCTTSFPEDEVEQAFRYMASGKHIGKVLVKIRDEEPELSALPQPIKMLSRPRFYCKSNASYIIIGGLGGFGLELADWLALRGCKNMILTSRAGLRTGYQAMRTRIWKGYNIKVEISTADVTTEQGVHDLLKQANNLGPVDGIFNLAVVLRDAIFENQTEEDFEISAKPKAVATQHLDRLTRKMCPHLRHFVIFSSVSCGRGNAGQTNYGLANSVMERICEQRKTEGLPALAVQWGAVGEVGLVAEMQEDHLEMVIGGTLQQRINSCLEVLDGFMFCDYPVVASMVVAEKRSGGGVAGNIVDTVVNILGLRDLKTISLHSTLAELGMDSMMAVEIKQTLEREFQVFLTPQDIRGMTFAKLQDIAAQTENEPKAPGTTQENNTMPEFGINHLVRVIGDEMLSSEPILRLPSLYGDGSTIEEIAINDELVFLIPGIEGVASVMEPLAKNLKAQALCLQFDYENTYDTIAALAETLMPHIKKRLRPGANFKLVGYSFGAMVTLEVVRRLESEGRQGSVWLIDGAPDFLQGLAKKTMRVEDEESGFQSLQIQLLQRFLDLIWPQDTNKLENELSALPDWDARVDYLVQKSPEGMHSKRFQKLSLNAAYNRILGVFRYQSLPSKCIASRITLIRPSEISLPTDDDYNLGKYCVNPVAVHFVDGNHLTILDNKKTADLINKPTVDDALGFKQSIMSTPSDTITSLQANIKQQ